MFGTPTDGLPKVISVHLGSPGRLLFAGLKLRKQTLSVRKFPFPELTRSGATNLVPLSEKRRLREPNEPTSLARQSKHE
jgi:hypothetical protein